MKKQFVVALIASALLGMAGTTQAGNSNHGNRSNHSGGYDRNHSSYGYYNGRSYGGNRYGRHHDHDHIGRGIAIVAGAVVLGSIISAINQDHSRQAQYQSRQDGYQSRQDGYQSRQYEYRPRQDEYRSQSAAPLPDLWYRVDTDGRCVEVRLNQQDREVWTDVDPSYCYD